MRSVAHYLRDGVGHTPFCPGCGHGILMGAILRALVRMEIDKRQLLFVSGIGCAGWIPSPHFDADTLHALHGRAIPFATGAKLANPRLTTIVISGDGDLAAIGGNHLIHGARRNTDITVICANNQTFGMTGGQASPTTPSPSGDSGLPDERPFDLTDLVISAGAAYAACYPVTQPEALSRAVENAVIKSGFTFVEAISPCPTHQTGLSDRSSIEALYDRLDGCCKSAEELADISEDERERYILTGEFTS